jgi:hypothetical protein
LHRLEWNLQTFERCLSQHCFDAGKPHAISTTYNHSSLEHLGETLLDGGSTDTGTAISISVGSSHDLIVSMM